MTGPPDAGGAEPPARPRGRLLEGLGYGLLVLVVGTPLNMVLYEVFARDEYAMLVPLLFLGFGQLVYVVPLAVLFAALRRFETLKGLLLTASVVLLLNSLCTGAMYFA